MTSLIAQTVTSPKFPPFKSSYTPTAPKAFDLIILTNQTDETKKAAVAAAIASTCSLWSTILEERQIHYPAIKPEEKKYDDKAIQTYNSLLLSIEGGLLSVQSLNDPTVSILIEVDSEQRIQGIAKVYEKKTSLKIVTLITAPWNVPLYAGKAPEHASIAMKGVGTTLVRQIYELAEQKKLSKITLTSLKQSESFYRDHLRMLSDKPKKYYFNVGSTSLPDSLK